MYVIFASMYSLAIDTIPWLQLSFEQTGIIQCFADTYGSVRPAMHVADSIIQFQASGNTPLSAEPQRRVRAR